MIAPDYPQIVPPGWRYTLVVIAHAKRMLGYDNCPADIRLRTLELFEKWSQPGEWLKPEMIAMIEPMPDEGEAIIKEARSLGCKKALDVFAQSDVFDAFLAINPSIKTALEYQHDLTMRGIK